MGLLSTPLMPEGPSRITVLAVTWLNGKKLLHSAGSSSRPRTSSVVYHGRRMRSKRRAPEGAQQNPVLSYSAENTGMIKVKPVRSNFTPALL